MMAWMVCANVSIGASHPAGAVHMPLLCGGEERLARELAGCGRGEGDESKGDDGLSSWLQGKVGTDVRDGRGRTSSRGAAAGAQRLAGAGLAASRAVTASGPRGG